ncbi:MAG: hypothetical protein KDA35_02415 [Hyphomonadaceae bacterium]|nr:hypothetical protein [Hyphomonadaceae bacterium]
MNLIPYHRFEITSRLSRAAALTAITSRIEKRQLFTWRWPSSSNDERFSGDVAGDGFSITRIMGYRNSFAPVIRGEVHAAGAFSRIVITMRPYIFVLVFCAFFVSLSLSTIAITPIAGVLMLAFLYAMVMVGFWVEANKQEQTLRKIFEAI